MRGYSSVPLLDGKETFYSWYRSIKLYARQTGCHRTLEGLFIEPVRRLPPAGSAPGEEAYDLIRPPNQRAGDHPPGAGQCNYPVPCHANCPDAGAYDDKHELAKEDVDEWRYWAAMESKSQALILVSIGPLVEAEIADCWCAHDMFTTLNAKYGPQPYLNNVIQLDSTSTPNIDKSLLTHMAEWQNRIALAQSINPEYSPGPEVAELFMKSLHTTVRHNLWGDWHRISYNKRTWNTLVEIFPPFVEFTRRNQIEMARQQGLLRTRQQPRLPSESSV